ncbi:hypothetical protein DEU31_0441 [Brachybacterium sp. AG952]|uniref:hypothetical protein n=1 Tax=Brachybacterium sp. AG952 TaxID=2183989 RepID=UPI0010DC9AC4|nr:hypothetical protein [Brachybacterium sp. AG952]TDP80026.1 hypothetical protein DEU31_0441 [Brachybacterium sp. AG952]
MSRTPVDHADPASSDEVLRSAAGTADGADGTPEGADGTHDAVDGAGGTDGADGADGADGVDGVDGTADGFDGAADGRDGSTDAAQEEDVPFGEHPATRFAADVEYSGRAGEHDYLVRVRHRLLDTSFTVVIDGVEHDPKAEEKARKDREKREASDGDAADSDAADGDAADGDLQFSLDQGFSTLRCTVGRRREGGEVKDCEVLTIRTAGLGGAGEVEVRHGFRTTLLVPTEGSPSALRDEKRTAHPTRYALIAALAKAAKFLIPLLGLGALFSGLLDPVKEWIEARIRPVVDAIVQATQPIRDWIGEVTRPVREFLDALLSPVQELIAAILRPIGEAVRWLMDLLPDIGLPFSVPGWLVDVLVPVIVVVAVFTATHRALRTRREKLAETTSGAGSGDDARAHAARSGGAGSDSADGADAETPRSADADAALGSRAHLAGGDDGAEASGPSPLEVEDDDRSAGERSTQG